MNMIFVALELDYQNKAYKIWILIHFEFFVKMIDLLQLQI
jgi:hypothetical protein